MSIRRIKDNQDRVEAKIDDLRNEAWEDFKEVHSRLDRILERLPPFIRRSAWKGSINTEKTFQAHRVSHFSDRA